MNWGQTVWRPPSEADSLIVQATVGCSHNACLFCAMYRDRTYRARDLADILNEVQWARVRHSEVRRVFLGDGNALSLPTEHLLRLLEGIRTMFPECRRVSCYAAPRDLDQKSAPELSALRAAGLQLLYVGLESGSDTVLDLVNKGTDAKTAASGCQKASAAGIQLSVMFISGLGGCRLSGEHAEASALLANRIQPEYLSLLSLMLPREAPLRALVEDGRFVPLGPSAILDETRRLLAGLELNRTVFNCNHASNYLPLSGRLPADKIGLLARIDQALERAEPLKPEQWRGL